MISRSLKIARNRHLQIILILLLVGALLLRATPTPLRVVIPDPTPEVMPIAGKWNGGDRARTGIYDRKAGRFILKNANITEGYLVQVALSTTDQFSAPIAGDWDGDGIFTPGLYESSFGIFRLLSSNDATATETRLTFGVTIPGGLPIAGDWNGDGKFGIGLYDQNTGKFYLRDNLTSGGAEQEFRFGPAGSNWQPLAGDWDGDGVWTVGLYDAARGEFHLAAANSNKTSVRDLPFADAGKPLLPISGAWDGGRISEIGLFDTDAAEFHLHQLSEQEYEDVTFAFGLARSNWVPLAGDWNGDGAFSVGLYAPSTSQFYLKDQNSNVVGRADYQFVFGDVRAWQPIAGDWNGDKKWSVGLYDPQAPRFYLRNSLSTGQEDLAPYCNFQQKEMVALAGDWDGIGQTRLGHFFPQGYTFNLCTDNGNVRPTYDYAFGRPGTGWLPIVGDWNGDGKTTAGLYDPALSRFHLTDENESDPREDYTFVFGKAGAGWLPVAGDWNHSGRWSVGLYDREKGEFHLRVIKPRQQIDQRFALFPTTLDNSNLRWFGYYNVDGFYKKDGFSGRSFVDEVAQLGYLNIGHLLPPLETGTSQQMIQSLDALRRAKMKAIINVQRMFVHYGRYLKAQPNADWQERVKFYQGVFAPYSDMILGFYFDEPIELGITQADMQMFTQALREAFPDQRVIVVESASQIANGNLTPDYVRYVTDLGIDLYYTDQVYGANQTQYLEGFHRLVADFNKQLWVIGEGYTRFGSKVGDLIDAFDLYYSLARATPQVTGMLIFLYPDEDQVNFPVTLRTLLDPKSKSYSPALRALHARVGQEITKRTESSIWTPQKSTPSGKN